MFNFKKLWPFKKEEVYNIKEQTPERINNTELKAYRLSNLYNLFKKKALKMTAVDVILIDENGKTKNDAFVVPENKKERSLWVSEHYGKTPAVVRKALGSLDFEWDDGSYIELAEKIGVKIKD